MDINLNISLYELIRAISYSSDNKKREPNLCIKWNNLYLDILQLQKVFLSINDLNILKLFINSIISSLNDKNLYIFFKSLLEILKDTRNNIITLTDFFDWLTNYN